jgi:hypothetical protein
MVGGFPFNRIASPEPGPSPEGPSGEPHQLLVASKSLGDTTHAPVPILSPAILLPCILLFFARILLLEPNPMS